MHQRDGCGESGLAGVDGALQGTAAHRLRTYIQAQRTGIIGCGFHELDNVEVIVRSVGQLAQCKLRCAIGALLRNEGIKPCLGDALNEAKAAHTRELFRQVTRLDIVLECFAPHVFAGGVQPARSLQRRHLMGKAALHIAGYPLYGSTKVDLGELVDLVLPPQTDND